MNRNTALNVQEGFSGTTLDINGEIGEIYIDLHVHLGCSGNYSCVGYIYYCGEHKYSFSELIEVFKIVKTEEYVIQVINSTIDVSHKLMSSIKQLEKELHD